VRISPFTADAIAKVLSNTLSFKVNGIVEDKNPTHNGNVCQRAHERAFFADCRGRSSKRGNC